MTSQSSTRPDGPRRRRTADEARKEILDAAQRRLDLGGPDALRLQGIARDVGISHPTILHHFGSRDGLIGALDDRALRALTRDIAQMVSEGGENLTVHQLVERVAQTMDQEGFAHLIAWWAMRATMPPTGELDPAALVSKFSKLIHDQIGTLGISTREGDGSFEHVGFGVRLSVIAMFGDALIGDEMSSLTGAEREAERHRFRAWLANIMLGALPNQDS